MSMSPPVKPTVEVLQLLVHGGVFVEGDGGEPPAGGRTNHLLSKETEPARYRAPSPALNTGFKVGESTWW